MLKMKNLPIVDRNSKYVVSAAEMKKCDKATIEHFGIPQDVLMERAALSICKYVKRALPKYGRVLIFAGSGNNGGDGIAAARILNQEGYRITLILVNHSLHEKGSASKRSGACASQLKIALSYGVSVMDFDKDIASDEIKKCDVIVDAMLGIGCSRNLEGDYLSAVCEINYAREELDENAPHVIAADIPTGINSDTGQVQGHAICADETVTFGFLKKGCVFYPGAAHAGEIHIVNVGITKEGFLDEPPAFKFVDIALINELPKLLLPPRNPAGNKGSFGKVLIAAGSKRIGGACIMSAESCLRSGAGMVRVFTEKTNLSAIQTLLPEAMTDTYSEEDFDSRDGAEKDTETLINALGWADAVVCGPGIGKGESGRQILRTILENAATTLILDADALNIIAEDADIRKLACDYQHEMVMTPHLAEFARLTGKSIHDCRLYMTDETVKLAKEFHASIICKDARSVVTDGERCFINLSGNDGMATAGSGDVLAGLLGALVLSGYSCALEAAVAATYLHGVAGDMAAAKNGKQGMTARDISGSLRDIFSGKTN